MPRTSPYIITLAEAERTELEARARRYTSPYSDVLRARIVLYAADGLGNDEIAARLDTPRRVVSKWHCQVGEPGRWGGAGSTIVTAAGSSQNGFWFPPEIISHCVWLYHRFPLSLRDVQELMLERGVDVCYETIRAWCDRFGQEYANQLRRRGRRPGDKWHLDEVFVSINGAQRYLWRAVDRHGDVLDILVQWRRNAVAATKFFGRLLTGLRQVPRVIVTDKLASYQVAHRELVPSVQHRRSKYLNNRAENPHQPTRQRERAMKRFKSMRHAQRFLSAFSVISPHFRPRRHLLSAPEYRQVMADRFAVWTEITGATTTAAA